MELWLEKMIRSLPGGLKDEIDGYLDEGTFISFAGQGTGGDSSGRDDSMQKAVTDQVTVSMKADQEANSGFKEMILDLLREPAWRGVKWRVPEKECNYVSVDLPPGLDAEVLLKASLLKGAAFWPGSFFEEVKDSENTGVQLVRDSGVITIHYAGHGEAEIRAGMGRIAEALSEFTARLES